MITVICDEDCLQKVIETCAISKVIELAIHPYGSWNNNSIGTEKRQKGRLFKQAPNDKLWKSKASR
jgi:hypothetical protein